MCLRPLPYTTSETDEYLCPVFTQLLLQLIWGTGRAVGPAVLRQCSPVGLGVLLLWVF